MRVAPLAAYEPSVNTGVMVTSWGAPPDVEEDFYAVLNKMRMTVVSDEETETGQFEAYDIIGAKVAAPSGLCGVS